MSDVIDAIASKYVDTTHGSKCKAGVRPDVRPRTLLCGVYRYLVRFEEIAQLYTITICSESADWLLAKTLTI